MTALIGLVAHQEITNKNPKEKQNIKDELEFPSLGFIICSGKFLYDFNVQYPIPFSL